MQSSISKNENETSKNPARLQVDPLNFIVEDRPHQTGSVFNIWYHKWSGGGDSTSKKSYANLFYRVNIKKDSGYTLSKENSYICLFFSRGCCTLGKNCHFLHRLPKKTDYFTRSHDCFGREKTNNYRDDMNGVGSFNRVNKTLYVGGLNMSESIENKLTKNFLEFGNIEKIRILYNQSCAFITYSLESEAQFAKEAMQDQSLGSKEILFIRWSNEDPSTEVQAEQQNEHEINAINTFKDLLKRLESDEKSNKNKKRHDFVKSNEQNQLNEKVYYFLEKDKKNIKKSGFFHPSVLNELKKLSQSKQKIDSLKEQLGDYESS